MKLYCCGFQIGLPDWPSIMAEGSGAIRPLRALSKSDVSSKGSACRNSAFAALVASVASLRISCDWEAAEQNGVPQARTRMHRVKRSLGALIGSLLGYLTGAQMHWLAGNRATRLRRKPKAEGRPKDGK